MDLCGSDILRACLCAGAVLLAGPAPAAESWPVKPVRIIVPFGTGGGTDLQARLLSAEFNAQTGQPFVVENRAGASGLIGAELAAGAPADGYTILFTTASITVNATLYGKRMKIDLVKDLAPVSWISSTPLVLVVHPSVPARSVGQLIALAKARPGVLNVGINTPGSTNHLAAEMLQQKAGIRTVFVPYKGGGPAITALMGGEIDVNFCTGPVAMANGRTGRLRALAVTTPKKASAFPELPTMASFYPGFAADNWFAMWFPAGTPAAIVTKLNGLIVKAVRSSGGKVRQFMVNEALDPVGSTPAEMDAHVRREIAKYAEVIRQGDIKLQ